MLVIFNSNANTFHYLSIKYFLYYSANHTYIFVGFEWMLHDEIVAFITLSAVQNAKNRKYRKHHENIFGPKGFFFFFFFFFFYGLIFKFFIWHFLWRKWYVSLILLSLHVVMIFSKYCFGANLFRTAEILRSIKSQVLIWHLTFCLPVINIVNSIETRSSDYYFNYTLEFGYGYIPLTSIHG